MVIMVDENGQWFVMVSGQRSFCGSTSTKGPRNPQGDTTLKKPSAWPCKALPSCCFGHVFSANRCFPWWLGASETLTRLCHMAQPAALQAVVGWGWHCAGRRWRVCSLPMLGGAPKSLWQKFRFASAVLVQTNMINTWSQHGSWELKFATPVEVTSLFVLSHCWCKLHKSRRAAGSSMCQM